jgi:hypothetical protein
MGFFSNLVGSVVDIALTPVAVVKDVVNVVTGNETNATKTQIEKAGDKLSDAIDDIYE